MFPSWNVYRCASMTRALRSALAVLALATLAGPAAAAAATPAAPTPTPIKLWFTGGEQFSVVDRTIQTYRTKALPTVNALLRGPTGAERAQNIATQIPDGVTVIRLTLDGKAAVIELSPAFLKGIPSPASARTDAQEITLNARLGQVIYTLTQFKEITSAKVLSDGQLLSLQSPKSQAATPQGTLGRKDFTKPLGAAPPTTTPTPPTPPAPLAGIKQIQQRLADIGFLPAGAVDGKAGYQTQQAVLAFQAWQGLGRDGVVGPLTKAKLLKAGRPQPRSGLPGLPARRMEVYRAKGVLLLISGGKVVRAIHVSPGGPATPTPSGTYKIFRKELQSWSVPFSVYLPYASYFNNGIAFHEYPDVPAYPASHGCVRVPAPEAKGVYAFAASGTTVVVI
jgi:lipoprotein-anchoring transpeptidase ErfK/SrfK